MEEWLNVGKIVNTHGIKGEVRVIAITDFPKERFKLGNKLFLFMPGSAEPEELIIKTHRTHKNFNLLTFEGYDNVNQVEKMRDGVLKAPASQRGRLHEGEFYFQDIIGCQMVTVSGEEIGKVVEILTPGANDVWVVRDAKGKEVLIPYIEPVVKKVDIQEKVIVIEPMEGLL